MICWTCWNRLRRGSTGSSRRPRRSTSSRPWQNGAQLGRIEAEQARINAALYTVAETAILTYRATGHKEGLPDEVIDAPVMAKAIMRAPLVMPVRRDAAKDKTYLEATVARGAAAIDAEIKALQQQVQGTASLAERIRIGYRAYHLDQAMKRSFDQHQREQDRER